MRSMIDFAIMIEEDAQLRYWRLAELLGDDPGGAGAVCRSMVATEGQHRTALMARRASLFRDAPPRYEISVLEADIERPVVDDDELPGTAREALEVALAAEWRAHAFFASALPHLADPDTTAFFGQLMEEEVEHAQYLATRIAELPAASGPQATAPLRPARGPWASPAARYPDRAALAEALPRFDAATRAVAQGVIVEGREPREVARALGVSRLTVGRKLSRFVALARQHLAMAAAAMALAGCVGDVHAASAPQAVEVAPVATHAQGIVPDRSEAETLVMQRVAQREREAHAAVVRRVHAQVATRMRAETPNVRRRLAQAILTEAERAHLDPLLVLALIHVESAFDPQAVSEAGARGLMQLLEPTMRRELERSGLAAADPHDPVANVRAGVRYLRRLVDAF
ncbi:MAG TPA: transglycosylase SLT domain-containing protein, partial [Anaeromyxobacteraceae bacterium]